MWLYFFDGMTYNEASENRNSSDRHELGISMDRSDFLKGASMEELFEMAKFNSKEPVIKEDFDPDRTSLTLKFIKKQAIKNKR